MIGLCQNCWSTGMEVIVKNGMTVCLKCNEILEKEKIVCESCGGEVRNERKC